MGTSLDAGKSELIGRLCDLARERAGSGPTSGSASRVVDNYFRHVAPEDLLDRSAEDLYGMVAAHLELAGSRPQGTANISVSTPAAEDDGWSAHGNTVVQVVTDDMPFLVDSVSMALEESGNDVQLVVHPQFVCRRDLDGELLEVLDDRSDTSAHDVGRESWMHLEIDGVPEERLDAIRQRLAKVLSDVREAVEDWPKMYAEVQALVEELRESPPPLAADEIDQGRDLLRWLADNHFTFLGYREYRLERRGDDDVLVTVPGTGLGILRSDPAEPSPLPAGVAARAREKTLLVLAKANSRATVHRPAHLDYVGVKVFDESGEVVGERRFLGLFSTSAYTESLSRIPLLREKARAAMEASGFEPMSHAGKALMDVLESFPREDLFQIPTEELAPIAEQVVHTRERRQLKLFVREDTYGRFLSCLVYLPRDRYNPTVGSRIAALLKEELGGESVEFSAHVGETVTARLHLVVRPERGGRLARPDPEDLERKCARLARSWRDDFVSAVVSDHGKEYGGSLARRYADSFPEAYKEDYAPGDAAADAALLDGIDPERGFDLSLHESARPGPAGLRLKFFRSGEPLSLSTVLPVLSSMGVEVVDERPYELDGLDLPTHVYDFGLRVAGDRHEERRSLLLEAVRAVWEGGNETDGFNGLVLAVGLGWREVALLRAYAKYMRQGSTPFSQDSIEEALRLNPETTRMLVDFFRTRFDPEQYGIEADAGNRVEDCARLEEQILAALDEVSSLDQDRILRAYLTSMKATLRTNFFQPSTGPSSGGAPHEYISLKLEPDEIDYLPEPRPRFEIFVCSPQVEGVHLRFGAVARGGLRWSDRRDDFRTEVLGLVKAQMVKNTVIVPVGSKGGFFPKMLPDPSDREAWLEEGKSCYRTFISGLLDLTDNLVDGKVVPPPAVVRHDEDDTYLVVAADKGTASFSDIANGVAMDYGYWLGDAFASGGSVGYDHKAMGITARGGWVSVQRHFREMGIDCQAEDFTCVGIGDMSGDVFGNGMLCSEHTRLVAAFDHRDIFVDPDPDPAASYAERRRLFELPRSSWQDYDRDLISEGGGVYSRSAKSITLDPRAQEALGVDRSSMTPAELMRAILLAPVDLLWNGGIGTYVKSESETHADAGDKANDLIRVDGGQLRVRAVGEGGNLGFTQRGRIEYALAGGRINTDFIDNSAGVDTSDHEVNIKILLDRVVAEGGMSEQQRNDLLASMTDEVASLVLADNYLQNLALANAQANASALLHVHEDWMRFLEGHGSLNRGLEALPSRREVAARIERGEGLTAPELSVLLAYTKIVLAERLLETGIADDPFLRSDLYSYFPSQMRQDYRRQMEQHPLHREIVVTQIVNQLVNGAGITYFHRLAGETSAAVDDLARANFVSREIFGAEALWRRIAEFDNRIAASVQTRMRLEVRTLTERSSRWLVNNRRAPLDSESLVGQFEVVVEKLMSMLPDLMTGAELEAFGARRDALVEQGAPEELATPVACCPPAYTLLGIVETSVREDVDPVEVARTHFALGERLGLSGLVDRILALPREDRWQTMARAALRDDLHAVHTQLTAQELAGAGPDASLVDRATEQLAEICADEGADLARLSVALRVVRSLLD